MTTSDITAYESIQPTEGTVAAPHEWELQLKMKLDEASEPTFVGCPDIDSLNPVATARVRNRSTYAFKGNPAGDKTGDSFVTTFNAEKVRDPETNEIAQPWLRDIIAASRSKGADNRRVFRWYDALNGGEAVEGEFRVEVARQNTSAGDDTASEFYTVTLTSYGEARYIEPVDVSGTAPAAA